MWRPTELGVVVAERELTLRVGEQERPVRLVLGQPVRSPNADGGEPVWWCPMLIHGLGPPDKLWTTAGEDSIQALTLSLDLARKVIPFFAGQAGGAVFWVPGDTDVVSPERDMAEAYAKMAADAMAGVRAAVGVLRDAPTGPLQALREQLALLVEKYGDR